MKNDGLCRRSRDAQTRQHLYGVGSVRNSSYDVRGFPPERADDGTAGRIPSLGARAFAPRSYSLLARPPAGLLVDPSRQTTGYRVIGRRRKAFCLVSAAPPPDDRACSVVAPSRVRGSAARSVQPSLSLGRPALDGKAQQGILTE